jgi:uncharacterized protein (TIGR00369 family)
VAAPIPEQVKRIFTQAPFIADLGLELVALGHGECATVLPLQQRHLQQDGYVHAGVHAAMADHTAGGAAATLIKKGQIVLTIEFKINLLRAAKGERLICRAKVLKPGNHFTVVESEVFCEQAGEEYLVSKATATLAVVAAKKA